MIGLLGRSRRDSMRKAARSNSRGIVKAARLSHREGAPRSSLPHPLVGVIMGSKSDWETMANTTGTLEKLGIPFEVRVVSAHRTPDHLFEYAESAERRGLEVIIAGAGGAAHLPGMAAAKTTLPVLGVPVESKALKGLDSLLSIVQMPAGVPVAPLAIGPGGAISRGLLGASIPAPKDPRCRSARRRCRAIGRARCGRHPAIRTADSMRAEQFAAHLIGARRGRNLAARELGDRRHRSSLPNSWLSRIIAQDPRPSSCHQYGTLCFLYVVFRPARQKNDIQKVRNSRRW